MSQPTNVMPQPTRAERLEAAVVESCRQLGDAEVLALCDALHALLRLRRAGGRRAAGAGGRPWRLADRADPADTPAPSPATGPG